MATFHPTLAPRSQGDDRQTWARSKRSLSALRTKTMVAGNLFGGLRVSMATTGYANVKEFQKAEVMVAPSLQSEGKALQRSHQVGMG